jgi:putative membrane protein
MDMMNSAGMGLFWIWPLLVVLGLAVLGYTIARTRGGARNQDPDEVSGGARQVHDERFARGEIDEQEYRCRRSTLDDRSR